MERISLAFQTKSQLPKCLSGSCRSQYLSWFSLLTILPTSAQVLVISHFPHPQFSITKIQDSLFRVCPHNQEKDWASIRQYLWYFSSVSCQTIGQSSEELCVRKTPSCQAYLDEGALNLSASDFLSIVFGIHSTDVCETFPSFSVLLHPSHTHLWFFPALFRVSTGFFSLELRESFKRVPPEGKAGSGTPKLTPVPQPGVWWGFRTSRSQFTH